VKKRKQHYVWEHYLKAWAVDGQVWCRRGGERRFHTSTENIAHRRDFYRLKEMSERDVQVVETLISKMSEEARRAARGWLPHFQLFHEAKRRLEASGRGSRDRDLERQIDIGINNSEEDLHASVEDRAIPLLAALRDGDDSILGGAERFAEFSWFIAMQYMRTPGVMRRSIEAIRGMIPGFSIEASWGLMRTIFATNIGGSLYARRGALRLTFLDAPAELEFVTGDQPIVNTRAVDVGTDAPPTELELFYPLTPTRALLMDFDFGRALTERRALSAEEATAFNQMICSESEGQIFARSENALIAPQ
jgi:hypothetical protein